MDKDAPGRDQIGYLRKLRRAWADRDLGTSRAAAMRLAVAQGRCLLYTVDAGEELLRPLPADVAEAAVAEVVARMPAWLEMAGRLRSDWGRAKDSAEAEEHCARLLVWRMDLWAMSQAITRAYIAGTATAGAEDALGAAVVGYDRVLEGQLDVLATLSGTGQLEHMRAGLTVERLEVLPWWLDGTLERVAERTMQRAAASLPGPEAWAGVGRMVGGPRWFP